MVKFSADTEGGTKILGLGLSKENVKHLQEGHPIFIQAAQTKKLIGCASDILLFYGETEESMKADMENFMSPSTKIEGDSSD